MNTNDLLERRHARLMLIQTLYIKDMADKSLKEAAKEMQENKLFLYFQKESGLKEEIGFNKEIFNQGIDSLEFNEEEIMQLIQSAFPLNESIESLDLISKNILKAALAEVYAFPLLDNAVIINEYTSIAASFLKENQTKFINALLDKLTKKIREKQCN